MSKLKRLSLWLIFLLHAIHSQASTHGEQILMFSDEFKGVYGTEFFQCTRDLETKSADGNDYLRCSSFDSVEACHCSFLKLADQRCSSSIGSHPEIWFLKSLVDTVCNQQLLKRDITSRKGDWIIIDDIVEDNAPVNMAQAVPKSNHKPKEHKKTSSISPAKVTKSATVGKSSKLVHAKADSVTVTADDCDDEVTTTSDCDGEETTTSDCEDSTTTSPSDCDDEPSFPSPTPTDDCDDVTSTSTDDCEEETSISDDCETSAPTSTPDCDDNFTDIDDDCDDDLPIITVTETIYKKLLKITTTKTHSTTLPFKIWAGTKTVTSTKTVTETATITETRFNATTTITRMTAQSSALQGLFQRLGLAVLTLPRPTITSPSALRAAHYGDDMHDLHKRDEMNATTELVSSQVSEAMNSSALTTASDNGALKYSPICVFSIGLAGLMVLAI